MLPENALLLTPDGRRVSLAVGVVWLVVAATASFAMIACHRRKKKPPPPPPDVADRPRSLKKSMAKGPAHTAPGAAGGDATPKPPTPEKAPVSTPIGAKKGGAAGKKTVEKAHPSKGDKTSQGPEGATLPVDKTQDETLKEGAASAKSHKGDKKAPASDDKNKEPVKKEGDKKEDADPPPILPEAAVQQLGNLDEAIKEKKVQLQKEIEEMPSHHEHDKKPQDPLDPNRHVVINEKKCKLYTTNNEETKEDDAPDDLI